jgi:hypothetical protein
LGEALAGLARLLRDTEHALKVGDDLRHRDRWARGTESGDTFSLLLGERLDFKVPDSSPARRP